MDNRFYDNGPIFISIGGEYPLQIEGVDMQLATALAKRHRGLHFALEHRYYENHTSIPVPVLDTQHLRYLTPEQAMADIIRFIKHKTRELRLRRPKWVAIGGSYAGNLAAWLRLKHPDIIYAAHSSSAPLNVIQEFHEYADGVYEVVAASAGNHECVNGWSRAINMFDRMIAETNTTFVLEVFGAPPTLNIGDLALLSRFFWISVQDGISPPQITIDGVEVSFVEAICSGRWFRALIDPNASDDDVLKAFIMLIPEKIQKTNQIVPGTTKSALSLGPSQKPKSFFSKYLDLEYHKWTCQQYFGEEYPQRDSNYYNEKYHGLDIVHKIDRVVYVTGDSDPWTKVAVTPTVASKSKLNNYAVMIKGGFHCKDLHVPLAIHPPSYMEAHKEIMRIWDILLGHHQPNVFVSKFVQDLHYFNYIKSIQK